MPVSITANAINDTISAAGPPNAFTIHEVTIQKIVSPHILATITVSLS
jgi:hypothetical protein